MRDLQTKAICCALLLAWSWPAAPADKVKTRSKSAKSEVLTCKLGTEDRQARMAVTLLNGKINSFAYYSKWNARTCSIDAERGGAYSKWSDNGPVTTVNSESGIFVIEQKNGGYHFEFRDVNRERFCGMDGQINGSLTVTKGRDQCALEGVMEEGTPLGEVLAAQEARASAAALARVPSDATAEPVQPLKLEADAPAATESEALQSVPAVAN